MKFDKLTSFPHPVFGRADDIQGVSPTVELFIDDDTEADRFVIGLAYSLQNPDIEKLIAERRATFLCEVGCSGTLYREVVKSFDFKQVFYIDKNFVRDQVDFLFLVVTTEAITEYENTNVHPELAGLKASLDVGDVLAYVGQQSFPADIVFKKINAASAFLEIIRGEEEHGSFRAILDHPRIQVRLPSATFDMFTRPTISKNTQLASTFHSSIVLPTLVFALQQLALAPDEFRSKAWARAIEWRLQNDLAPKGLQLEAEATLDIAQALLSEPVDRLLEDLSLAAIRTGDGE